MFTARFIYKGKTRNNVCGLAVAKLRKAKRWSQRELSDQLQLNGLDIDKNAIQRIESGQRFVIDIELKYLADVLGVSIQDLYDISN